MNFDLGDQISDNLRNLVMTNHGERVGIYDFGANLRALTLELSLPAWEEEAMTRIKTSVSKYMPFVNLQTFDVVVGDQTTFGLGRVAIRMSYTVSGLADRERAIEIIMHIAG
jgi:phage baseplate assembly protein W